MKFMKSAAVVAALSAVSLTAMARDVEEQSRDVSAFTEVSLKGSMDAEITVGKERSVRVIADDHIIDRVITEVRGDTLYLEMEKGSYRNIRKLEVIITVPSLEAAGIYGSGDMKIENAKADDFELDLKGSGDALISDAEFGQFTIDLAGSGDIDVDGTCSDLKLDLRGSGDVSARRMECESASVDLRGSGDITVFASKDAGVTVRGSGDVDIYGKPGKVNSNVRGSGDVNLR